MPPTSRELFDKNWDNYYNNKINSGNGRDQGILLVSSGSFVVSISYLATLNGIAPNYPLMLFASWVLLGLSIAAHLYAYSKAVEQSEMGIKFLNTWDGISDIRPILVKKDLDPEYIKVSNAIDMLNHSASWFLIAGIAFLLLFGIFNLDHSNYSHKECTGLYTHPESIHHRDSNYH